MSLKMKYDFNFFLDITTRFYKKATNDFMIGYHFRKIDNFDEHIPRIASFWQLQINGKIDKSITMPFDLINAHLPLGVKRGEIGRWVHLFKETLNETEIDKEIKRKWLEKVNFFQEVLLKKLTT